MALSFAETAPITCPECSHAFPFEVWLIVAADERPDLVERIRASALHTLTCPQCGQTFGGLDVPLLIYRPSATPPILFSPAQQTTNEQDQQQAIDLLGMLRKRMGNAWRDEWRAKGVPGVQRAMLPVALADDPEAAQQELHERDSVVFAQLEAQARQAMRRFFQTGDRNALDTAVTAWNAILEHPDFDTTQRAFRLAVFNDAGSAFLRRYWARGLDQDLDHAIALWAEAVRTTPPDSSALPIILSNLGNGLSDRYARTGQPEDLEQAIRVFQQAVQSTPPDSPNLPGYLSHFGAGLRDRYARTGRMEDLEQAIHVFQQAVQSTLPDSPDLPGYLSHLGAGLCDRYARTMRMEDLEQAIRVYQQAVQTTPLDSPDLPMHLNNLGIKLNDRYARTGQPEDLEQAIRVFQQAVQTAPPDSPDLPGYLNNLGNVLRARYARTGRPEDLEQTLQVYRQAVHITPSDSLILPMCLSNLGTGLSDRYTRTGRLEDLEQALGVYQQAVQTALPDSPDLPGYLTNLGNGLRARYARTGQLEDLEQAIRVFQQAVQTAPSDSPDLPIYLNNLGNGLNDRYARTGQLEDLEQAIRAAQQAVQITPPDSPDLPMYRNNLGDMLRSRYAQTGRLEDLEQAIRVAQQAVQTALPDSPNLPMYLNNLGAGLGDRYTRTGQLEDLEQAIRVYQQAVQTAPPDSPDLPGYLNNLGNGLRARYARTGQMEDLEQAIRVAQQAVHITPPGSPTRPIYLDNLGDGLGTRYARTGRLEDLEEALRAAQQAVQTTPPDSPTLPSCLSHLGNRLRDRYVRTGRLEDLKQAQTSYATACARGQLLAPEVALIAAHTWGYWASERKAWEEAVEAFESGIATGEQLHRTQLRRSDQETWLSGARGLHMHAAYALVQTATPTAYRRAVEVAEIGRARGLGEALARDRSDLSDIEINHPEIYERYRVAADQVRQFARSEGENQRRSAQISLADDRRDLGTRILAARAELDAAINAIRTLPGYKGFLLPPPYAEIVATVRPDIPLVYVITTPQGSLALIVSSGADKPDALLLDGFTESKLNALLITREGDKVVGGYLPAHRRRRPVVRHKRKNDKVVGGYLPGQLGDHQVLSAALNTALPLLGKRLMARLAARLREMKAHGVTIVPTGMLSLLPLHAATYVVKGESRCLLDEFDVAYAPSARVLTTAQREANLRQGALRLAGVGNPTRDLSYAGPELAAICDLLPTGAATAFYEEQARRESLWRALPEATIAHFACHGNFANDPLDSALYLAGGDRITLRDLVTGDTSALANLHLVVMSACQTAITDFQRVPDESIGLPGGFLQAGVPAVVGTLWSVDDLSTALLMHRFYELYLLDDSAAGMGPQSPARALRLAQRWLRELSYQGMYAYFEHHRQLLAARRASKGKRMPSGMVNEGRLLAEEGIEEDPQARPYAAPRYWAAFTFSGVMEGANDGR